MFLSEIFLVWMFLFGLEKKHLSQKMITGKLSLARWGAERRVSHVDTREFSLLVHYWSERRCVDGGWQTVDHYFSYFGPSVTVKTDPGARTPIGTSDFGPSVTVQTVSDSRRPLFSYSLLLLFSCWSYHRY
jgi:hypothetical protein